jgi:uncharacterized protein
MDAASAQVFQKHKYINLETYRKSGAGVQTPVWFAQDGAVLYVWTGAASGKVKRIRRSGQVKVAPSDMRGGLLGDWVSGAAEIAPPGTTAYQRGKQLVDRKYGLMKRMFDLLGHREEHIILTIRVEE